MHKLNILTLDTLSLDILFQTWPRPLISFFLLSLTLKGQFCSKILSTFL